MIVEAKNMKTEELIGALVELDKQGKENRALTNAYKAELQARGIKNAELIRAFLPEELIDNTINEIRKCILVETKTSITLDYKEEE